MEPWWIEVKLLYYGTKESKIAMCVLRIYCVCVVAFNSKNIGGILNNTAEYQQLNKCRRLCVVGCCC